MPELLKFPSARRQYIRETVEEDSVVAIIPADGDISADIPSIAADILAGGIRTMEVVARVPQWPENLRALVKFRDTENPGIVVGLGSVKDIFTIHQAMEIGAELLVSHLAQNGYQNVGAIPSERWKFYGPLAQFVDENAAEIQSYAASVNDLRAPMPFMMDPLWYVLARGGEAMFTGQSLTGVGRLRDRGAYFQKLYRAGSRPAEEWQNDFVPVTGEECFRIILTGDMNVKNVADYVQIPGVVGVGASYIAKGRKDGTIIKRAEQFREIVRVAYNQRIGDKGF